MLKDEILAGRTKEQAIFEVVPQVMLFDMCGTLIDSKQADLEAINRTLKMFGKPEWAEMRKLKEPLKSMKQNFPNFFGDNAERAYDVYIENLASNIGAMKFFDGALENLENCKRLGIKTGVITNRDLRFTQALANNEGFKDISCNLDIILSADEVEMAKPNPIILEKTLYRLGHDNPNKKSVIFVGDAMADISVAVNYGCTPLLLVETMTDINKPFVNKYKNDIKIAKDHREIVKFVNGSLRSDANIRRGGRDV